MRIEVVDGDITALSVDAVVNAANSALLGGGGVDGAIHAAGGPSILEACQELRRTVLPAGLPMGEAVATTAGDLPARFVIHTVGPIRWEHADGGADALASCHRRCLEVADGLAVGSVAFPAISCGAYGWDPVDAAPVAVAAVRRFALTHARTSVALVQFVLFNDAAATEWRRALQSAEGPAED
jgi:O-acetyl-ADP-ribose deacetylase (regulator of RNase III)